MAKTVLNKLRMAAVAAFVMLASTSFAEVSYCIVTSSNDWNVDGAIVLTSEGDDIYAATTTMTDDVEFKIVAVENGEVTTSYGMNTMNSYEVTEAMIKDSSEIPLTVDGSSFQIGAVGDLRIVVDMSENSEKLMVTTVEHSITIVNTSDCEIVVDNYSAHWGERVGVTAHPHAPYAFNNFIFTKTFDGSQVDLVLNDHGRFEMPNFDLTIAASVRELEFYLVGDYNGWKHMGDDPKFSVGDDGLWHRIESMRTDQGFKVVDVGQILYSSSNNTVTDDMIKSQTPIMLEAKGNANDDDDLIAHPIIYLQNEGTRDFILDSETMLLTVAGIPHDITLTPVTQGTAQLSTHSARWGESVTISINPMGGYSLKNIEVKAEDGSLIGVIDEVFEMPDQSVTVTVTYEETRYGQCGDNLSWSVNSDYSSLSIEGNGPMYDYDRNTQPWLNFMDRITSLSIGNGVETLGAFAFYGMNNLDDAIDIPDGVVSIGNSCFEFTKIISVRLPSSISSIGENAFHSTAMATVNLEDCTSSDFNTLAEGVFQNTSLKTITIPANITSLGRNSFADNRVLEEVTLLSETTPQLGDNVFGGVTATLKVDNVDVYHAIRKAGSQWGNASQFTIRPIDEHSFRYAIIEGIESGYVYTGQPLPLSPRLMLCEEVLSASNYDLKYYKDNSEVETVVDTGTYRCEFTAAASSDYKDSISKTFIVSEGGESYIDENGKLQTLPSGIYYEYVDDLASLSSGWYVVKSDVYVSNRIEVEEDGVKILLCDGCTLTAEKGIHCSKKELTIYGQSANSGMLFANGYEKCAGIGGDEHESGPILTINGGEIVVTSSPESSAAAIGGGDQGYWSGTYGSNISVTINGGIVTAISRGYGAGIGGGGCDDGVYDLIGGNGGIITINGGQVDASSDFGFGIGPGRIKDLLEDNDGEKGSISIGWTNSEDFVKMSSVCGNLEFKNNFAISGEYIKATPDNVDEKYFLILQPANVIDIAEGIEHGSVEMDYNACPIGEAKQFSVYVYPDEGYKLDEIKVSVISAKDTNAQFALRSNDEVPVTKLTEHEYIFDMPDANVMVNATFQKETYTGVETVVRDHCQSSGTRYNVMGQRVDERYKGVVIVDGKKLIIK